MRAFNPRLAGAALIAGLGLAGCTTYGQFGNLGVGVGYGGGYGAYGRGYCDPYYDSYCSYGYSPYGYSPYGYSRYGYSPYGYQPYYGWYDGYYYPGTGYYVYDRDRRAHKMSDAQRRYWEMRRKGATPKESAAGNLIQNWADFQNGQQTGTVGTQGDRATVDGAARPRSVSLHEYRARQRAQARQESSEPRQVRRSESRQAGDDSATEDRQVRRGGGFIRKRGDD